MIITAWFSQVCFLICSTFLIWQVRADGVRVLHCFRRWIEFVEARQEFMYSVLMVQGAIRVFLGQRVRRDLTRKHDLSSYLAVERAADAAPVESREPESAMLTMSDADCTSQVPSSAPLSTRAAPTGPSSRFALEPDRLETMMML